MPASLLRNLTSSNDTLKLRSVDLNEIQFVRGICPLSTPIARYVNNDDLAHPPAPAWYLPDTGNIFIHVDDAQIGTPRRLVCGSDELNGRKEVHIKAARTLGLLAHEAGHAAISNDMDRVVAKAPQHRDLLTLLEELRVENHALRKVPMVRRFLRASFGIVLANLPDDFTSKAHVVRAWAIARGRTLAGVALPDETDPVDTAARTLLDDDVVDGLTDLLQEALTLHLDRHSDRLRLIEICDEWVELVGEPAEATGCTTCVRKAKPGEKGEKEEATGGSGEKSEDKPDDSEGTDGEGSGGDDTDKTEEGDSTTSGSGDGGDDDDDEEGESAYGTPGSHHDDTEGESGDALTDEDEELMKMVKRDLADTMNDEWQRDVRVIELSKPGEWGQRIFGNRSNSSRLTSSQPSAKMRQNVVKVAAELSNLMLPAVSKVSKASMAPPGRMRSREALRASAERAQGKMVTAQPWRTTVRRHSTARPLVLGIATDTSGSMKWAENAVAQFAYVYANAGHRIGARTAAVTFGSQVFRIARPGEVMTEVLTKTANDSTEMVDNALAALDGVLHLTTPSYAARICIVVSDGALVESGEPDKAYAWMKAMDKAGTHVIWITDRPDSGYAWINEAAKLPHFTRMSVLGGERRDGESTFDLINAAVLRSIHEHVH